MTAAFAHPISVNGYVDLRSIGPGYMYAKRWVVIYSGEYCRANTNQLPTIGSQLNPAMRRGGPMAIRSGF